MTEYLVLVRVGAHALDVEQYETIGRAEAHGPMQAIKAVAEARDTPPAGETEHFVAVPVRNWTAASRTVKVPDPVVSYAELPTIGSTATGPQAVPDPEPEPATDDAPEPAEPEDEEPAAATA